MSNYYDRDGNPLETVEHAEAALRMAADNAEANPLCAAEYLRSGIEDFQWVMQHIDGMERHNYGDTYDEAVEMLECLQHEEADDETES